jgi:hypothetical protein
MTYSIAHYIKMCKASLENNSTDCKNERHLLAIKNLMLFYLKHSQKTFLSIIISHLHHSETADTIIRLIDTHQKLDIPERNKSPVYEKTINKIQGLIQKARSSEDFNREGDFANIYETLVECRILMRVGPLLTKERYPVPRL